MFAPELESAELAGDLVPNGADLAPQDVGALEAQLALVEGSSESNNALALDGTVTATVGGGDGDNIGDNLTITLPPMDKLRRCDAIIR